MTPNSNVRFGSEADVSNHPDRLAARRRATRHRRLVTIEIDNFTVLKVRTSAVTGAVVPLTGSLKYRTTRNRRDAMTDAVLGAFAKVIRVRIWKYTKGGIALFLLPLSFLCLTSLG